MIEIADVTDDEVYYPCGYFESLEDANAAIDSYFQERGIPPNFEATDGFVIKLELRELPIGLTTSRTVVSRRTWTEEYDSEKDIYYWTEQ